jgi:hypothetical protein
MILSQASAQEVEEDEYFSHRDPANGPWLVGKKEI